MPSFNCVQIQMLFVLFSDQCKKEYSFFEDLLAHLSNCYENEAIYKCPYCSESIQYNKANSIQDHLKTHDFGIFQCIFCKKGFGNLSAVKVHMSESHASQFLLVAIREPTSKKDVECQIVYVNDFQDYPKYTFSKCSDLNVLSCMNPNELNSKKQFDTLEAKLRENGDLKVTFNGKVPAIDFFFKEDENGHMDENVFKYSNAQDPILEPNSSNSGE